MSKDKKGTLIINEIDPNTDEVNTLFEAASVSLYDLKVMAEKWVYDNKPRGLVIHWVWISTIITLVPELVQNTDKSIIVGSIDKNPNLEITIIR